jgi:hypothetical protein
VDEQSQLPPPQQQNWVSGYKLIADAVQNRDGVAAGVRYFFNNVSSANANNPNSPDNVFVRSTYQAGAFQGVSLSDEQMQAVSGDIGNAVLSDIANSGKVPAMINPTVTMKL